MAKQPGFFITVEGIDGSGKSTHVKFIQTYLEDRGYSVITAHEPGGTDIGEKIRDILLHSTLQMHSITELLLVFASRQELISNTIVPNLKEGGCVILDRFIDSSIAYQCGGRGIEQKKLERIISLLEPQIKPDLTFLFDVELSIARGRLAKNNKKDRIEGEGEEFFAKVQNMYHEIAKNEPKRVKTINTVQPKEETKVELSNYLNELLTKC